jgi:hypothetical protein
MLTIVTDKIAFGRVVQWLQRRGSASTTMKKIGCPQRRPFGDDSGNDSLEEEVSYEEEYAQPPRSEDGDTTDTENDDDNDDNDGREDDDDDNDRKDDDDDSDDQCSDDTFD